MDVPLRGCSLSYIVYTHKHAETVSWYCQKLGFEIDYNAPGEYASLHHKLLGRLAIHATDKSERNNEPLPYFLCDDIHTTIAEFREKGIAVTEPVREGESPWFADFCDNVGNRWGIEEL